MGVIDSIDLSSSLADGKENTVTLGSYDLEPSRYMAEMDEFDISDDEKVELLQTLWSIMRTMVELGFDPNFCERIFKDSQENPAAIPDDV